MATLQHFCLADVFQEILPSYGFEQREGQEFKAYHVENAIKKKAVLLAEAGVGIGKTFAYLIPALMFYDWLSELLRKTLIISTNTIILQHQLMKDINHLIQLLSIKIDPDSIVLAKGKNNFLCPIRADAYKIGLDQELYKWTQYTLTGDRNEAPPCLDKTWQAINVDESCNCNQCEAKTQCCYLKQRKKWLRSRIVITNHQQLIADTINREQNPRTVLFSDPDMVIIDEAHRFEEAAVQMLGSTFTFGDLKKMPKLVKRLEQQLMYYVKGSGDLESFGAKLIQELRRAIKWDNREESGRAFINIDTGLCQKITRYMEILNRVSDLLTLAVTARQRLFELESIIEKTSRTLQALIDPNNFVFWAQMKGLKVESINAVPLTLSEKLNSLFWKRQRPTILTSATLTGSNAKDYDYWLSSLGIAHAQLMKPVESPFDFANRRIVYLPSLESIPSHDSESFLDFVIQEIERLVKLTDGRTLILLTSHKDMDNLSHRLSDILSGYQVLFQGQEQETRLLEHFKKFPQSVLLGTAYWEGVDLPGSSLISVICVKLPFSPPDPILEARSKKAKEYGKDPFEAVYLPLMLLKLKQGVGRLIRSSEDYGVFTILDKRSHLGQKSYSKLIHNLLQPSEIVSSMDKVEKFIRMRFSQFDS